MLLFPLLQGLFNPAELLASVDLHICKAKEKALSRREIMEKVEKWMSACEEESWLEDYSRVSMTKIDTTQPRGTHLNLKQAERARVIVNKLPVLVDSLVAKTQPWEEEHGFLFVYDGISGNLLFVVTLTVTVWFCRLMFESLKLRLLDMLEEYSLLRQEKEEEKRLAQLPVKALGRLGFMDSSKRIETSSSAKKKRKSQPKLDAFLSMRPSVHVGGASNDAESVANAQSVSQVLDSNTTCDNVNVNVASQGQEGSRKPKGRWRNQWTLFHPWAYLCKSLLNEEIIKCAICEETKKVNIYTQVDSSSIMISALHDHASTRDHKDAMQIINAKKCINDAGKGPLDHGIETIVHTKQMQILTCMKLVYFCACEDLPLDKYPSQCRLLRELGTPIVPASDEYGSYVNSVSGREMLLAIKDYVKLQMLADMCASPFFSVLIDESTDRTMEKHLIMYVLYVGNGGMGRARCSYVELLPVANANAKGIYDAVSKFLHDNGLDIKKLIAIATDGASVMVGHKTGVVARFQGIMPQIMGVHCIAHRQALAAKDGFVSHPHVYTFVDKVANKVYSWLGKSAKRHTKLLKIMSDYDIIDAKALQIHSVRWLSRGQVIERLVNIMPAVLEQW
ncbi:hypothetical protein L7F22_000734 [Adiantum nelumboides]|nr:hypothetical protein [Adiantum nelumboides]